MQEQYPDIREQRPERPRSMQEDHGVKNEGTLYHGVCDIYNNMIYILDELGDTRKAATVRHEVTHAITVMVGPIFGLTEEELCNFMSAHHFEIDRVTKEYMKHIRTKRKPKIKPKDETPVKPDIHRDTETT